MGAQLFEPYVPEKTAFAIRYHPSVHVELQQFTDLIGRRFKQPKEGPGFDSSPVAHMWRSLIRPDAPL